MRKKGFFVVLLLACLAVFLIGRSTEEAIGAEFPGPVPKNYTMTSWQLQAQITIAISNMAEYLLKKEGVTIRMIPHATGLARLAPVRSGSIEFVMGSASHVYYQWGHEEASHIAWGPQPLRRVAICLRPKGSAGYITNDPKHIKKISDIKGKTLPYLVGNKFWNLQYEVALASVGLSKDDVKWKKYPSMNEAAVGFKTGEIDLIQMGFRAPVYLELDAKKRLHLLEFRFPKEGTEAMKRIRKVDPYGTYFQGVATSGPFKSVEISPEKPFYTFAFANPIISTYPNIDKSKVYHLTRMIIEHQPDYANLFEVILDGFSLKNQLSRHYNLPWHEGAVEYFKEIGVWTDVHEVKNQSLIRLQEEMLRLWKESVPEFKRKKMSDKEWSAFWLQKAKPYVNQYLEKNIYGRK